MIIRRASKNDTFDIIHLTDILKRSEENYNGCSTYKSVSDKLYSLLVQEEISMTNVCYFLACADNGKVLGMLRTLKDDNNKFIKLSSLCV